VPDEDWLRQQMARTMEWARREEEGTTTIGRSTWQGHEVVTSFFPASDNEDYETMVFPANGSPWVPARYTSRQEAEAGHWWAVCQLIHSGTRPVVFDAEFQLIDAVMRGVPIGEVKQDGKTQQG
jgi:hypothetical protein